MGKSCYICKYSVVVKYTEEYKYNKPKDKKEELFCIAAPPNTKNKFIWGHVSKGYRELIKHREYPIVRNVAVCSLYSLTDNKKKIEKYKIRLEKEKQKIKEMKIQKKQEKEDEKKEKIQKKIKLEKEKAEKEKIKQEKLREENKRKQQKVYRDRKKAERIEAEKKANRYNRFEIMDI